MIELRWVVREEGNPLRIKVLQYRRQTHQKILEDENGKHWRLDQWSDWIDVPTVTEG